MPRTPHPLRSLLLAAALIPASALAAAAPAAARSYEPDATVQPGPRVPAVAGATTPFVTIEAESGSISGAGARKRALAGVGTVASLESEASGYGLVELKNTNDSLSITNTTGKVANSLVVRASIPDAANGGGIDATIDLYVNGVFRQAIPLSSKQAWNYRGATTNPDDPNAGGMPYRFYNEFPVRITGAPIAAGQHLKFQKGAANKAAVYDLDSIDLENVGAERTQPANSLSVVTYGADPAFGKDSTTAIQNAVNAARSQGRSVWLPKGKYLINSTVSTNLDLTGVKVEGAGMWYTTLYRRVPLPTPANWRSQIKVGSGTTLTDVQIDANAIYRGVKGPGGSDYGVNASGAGGWLVERIWTRHTDANWLSGSNGVARNSRTADSYGDGFNTNNSNHKDPDLLGLNLLVQNNFARGTGDDSFATYSDAGTNGDSAVMSGTRILNNTAVAPWWANGIRVAGGRNIQVRNNLVNGSSSNSALEIGSFGDTGHPTESATISDNILLGGGGWNGTPQGVKITSPSSTSLFPNAFTTVTLSNNLLRGALRAGVLVDRTRVNVTLTNNTIDRPAQQGIRVNSGVTGTGRFSGNTIQNLAPGQVATQNESPSTFTITG
ncbi:glycosyl hydrolase family 28-related protein [Kribbella sp. DT2]|uniref:glycosyl hydrolase family 28-related protein n=1 Tax=Kribbella sp. DT2 TaxID=3393427 RepID=UPI003CF5E5F0